jgi:hypothetical protein
MAKSIKIFLKEAEKLKKENAALKQKLHDAMKSIDAVKRGGIDVLVVADKKKAYHLYRRDQR